MLDIALIAAAVVGGLIMVVVALAATRPNRFRVARSVLVEAPPKQVFDLINSPRAMNTWNPFDRQDPTIVGTYSGPDSGVGAHYAFESPRAGKGSFEIIEAVAPTNVTLRLLMSRPMACDNRVEFLIEPLSGTASRVTWAMTGPLPLFGRVVHLVVNMDRMVGGMFEKGLADLKSVAEGRQAA